MSFSILIHRSAIALLAATCLIDLWWVYIDLTARFGLGTVRPAPFDTLALTQSMTIWNDLAFYTHVPAMILSLWLLLKRSQLALATYTFAITMTMIDWLLLIGNEHYEESLFGYFSFGLHASIFMLICLIFVRRELR